MARHLCLLTAILLSSLGILAERHPVIASAGTAPWTAPAPIVSGLTQAARPSLAYTPDGASHAMWESNGRIFHSRRAPGAVWSAPQDIAAGISPSLVVNSAGRLFAVFANNMLGNLEIYSIQFEQYEANRWSLPIVASRTTGVSANPVVAAGPNGALYLAWADKASKDDPWLIYVGSYTGSYWQNRPLPNARGQSPAIAVAGDNTVYVTWQDRGPDLQGSTGLLDVYISESRGESWSLPINVSDSADADSIGPSIATTADSLAQLTWVDGGNRVRYAFGRGLLWPLSRAVSQADTVARGARITVSHGTLLHIAWDEGSAVLVTSAEQTPSSWPEPQTVTAPTGNLKDICVSSGAAGGVTISWVQALQPGNEGIYESRQVIIRDSRSWLPFAFRHQGAD